MYIGKYVVQVVILDCCKVVLCLPHILHLSSTFLLYTFQSAACSSQSLSASCHVVANHCIISERLRVIRPNSAYFSQYASLPPLIDNGNAAAQTFHQFTVLGAFYV